jgi:hypothetical protein
VLRASSIRRAWEEVEGARPYHQVAEEEAVEVVVVVLACFLPVCRIAVVVPSEGAKSFAIEIARINNVGSERDTSSARRQQSMYISLESSVAQEYVRKIGWLPCK